ncbi:DUF3341 domain-containing protein [Mangrovibacterium lignilyticum]|uniref:DUF3341 domain-containing protein n=1 Tax=Mangrovibacterium lignilyticum TaxID=2668052 RepID=UPI0013D87FF3|nr:DUF3341 domain-containing protein [Mangrovibacterium lignilyticum]
MVGVFDNEFDLVKAFEKVKAKGVKVDEVYTPYPIHEILEGMGKKTRITHAAFFYGLFGALTVLGGMYYAAVISWPLNFGGKPFNTFPSFIVVTIVATILIVTITTLFTFSARAQIFPGKAAKIVHPGATDDKFVMVLKSGEAGFEAGEIEQILKDSGASEIIK